METKQTAVDTLFEVFKVMSNAMREAGDEQYANILDYLCDEFLNKAKAMEKEQIEKAFKDSMVTIVVGKVLSPEQYYEQTYGDPSDHYYQNIYGKDQGIEESTD